MRDCCVQRGVDRLPAWWEHLTSIISSRLGLFDFLAFTFASIMWLRDRDMFSIGYLPEFLSLCYCNTKFSVRRCLSNDFSDGVRTASERTSLEQIQVASESTALIGLGHLLTPGTSAGHLWAERDRGMFPQEQYTFCPQKREKSKKLRSNNCSPIFLIWSFLLLGLSP